MRKSNMKEGKMKNKLLISLLAISLLAVGAFAGSRTVSSVFAQTSAPSDPVEVNTEDATVPFGFGYRNGYAYGAGNGPEDPALAAKLGLTVEELYKAHETAFDLAVAQALADGLITQEQADQLTTTGWGQLFNLIGRDALNKIDRDALLAQALGISKESLVQARLEVRTEALNAAVAAGRLTQEQAEFMLANIQKFVGYGAGMAVKGSRPFGGKRGGMGGYGPGGGTCNGTCDGTRQYNNNSYGPGMGGRGGFGGGMGGPRR